MQKISHENITELLSTNTAPAVTIYIPMETTAAPPHITENQIRFKNMVHKAIDELHAWGDISKLDTELSEMLDHYSDDLEFWKSQSRALLICAAPGKVEMFSLPVDTEEYVAVDDMFHLAPVLALLGDSHEYYVLALAQQHPKLYKGDMYGLEFVDANLPASLREGLHIDEVSLSSENQGSAVGLSIQPGWFNGRGASKNPAEADRMKFFHMIDKVLHDKTYNTCPLIIAGIDAEIAEFRELSRYPHIMKGAIQGNHTGTNPSELFASAQEIVRQELVQPDHMAIREEYERLSGANPDRVAHDKTSILLAAEQGRIDKLLAMMSRNTTDTVQDKVESVFQITFPEAGHSKTLNKLASKVWQMSGKIVSLLPSEMPNGAPMVARLRY